MSDVFDGMGTVAEGGLFARAMEPDSGAKSPHPDQPENCLNCGTLLTGAYCRACGQKGHIHRTIGAFMHDLLHGALHFEGKFWHTLPLLVFRPGVLTRRYIDGQRARFVSPMALFLFTVFLMFAVFQVLGFTAPTDLNGQQSAESTVEELRGAARGELADLREQLKAPDLTDAERAELQSEIRVLEVAVDQDPAGLVAGVIDGASEATGDTRDATEETATNGEIDTGPVARADLRDLTSGTTGVGWIDNAAKKWSENPGLMLYKLQANAYKFSWMLIPISIPFVWLLFFWKRRFRAYDHAIFVTYSLSFMTLLFIVASTVPLIGIPGSLSTLAVLLIPPIHLYKQLRYAYEIGRFSAFWRLMVLSVFIWIVVALFVQLLLLLGTF